MKPLFALFVAGCTFLVVAACAVWAWQTGSPFVFGSGRLDGAEPPGNFVVVVHEPANGGYRYLRWEQLPEVDVDGMARTFVLPPTRGGDRTALGERQSFEVIESDDARQVVEVNVLDTHQSWSRYEAFPGPRRSRCLSNRRRADVRGDDRLRGARRRRMDREAHLLAGGEANRRAWRHGVRTWDPAPTRPLRPFIACATSRTRLDQAGACAALASRAPPPPRAATTPRTGRGRSSSCP